MNSGQTKITATFTDSSGQHIFYRNWKIDDKPKGIVLIVHGLNSHSGYYENFAMHLNANYYEVYAIDLRGRGRSEGERYFIGHYQEVIADIDQLVVIAKSADPQIPVILFGHSAGGVFASVYAAMYQDKLSGLISESFAFRLPAPGFALATIKLLAKIFPHTKMVRLKNEDFSRDKSVVDRMNNDPLLANEKQPLKTMEQLILAGKYLENKMPGIKLPLLILHGTADKATNPEGSTYFMNNVSSADKTLKLYEGHYHDLINDKFSGIVIKDILRWLNERTL